VFGALLALNQLRGAIVAVAVGPTLIAKGIEIGHAIGLALMQ
jgi:hypothetical protein